MLALSKTLKRRDENCNKKTIGTIFEINSGTLILRHQNEKMDNNFLTKESIKSLLL